MGIRLRLRAEIEVVVQQALCHLLHHFVGDYDAGGFGRKFNLSEPGQWLW